jgi:hypothetical protein
MQDLDYLLTQATDSLLKAQESQISLKENDPLVSIQEPQENLFKSKGLVLLPISTASATFKSATTKELKKDFKKDPTAGPQWFNMPAIDMTDQVKKDLHILRNRGVLDPKRHYRKEKISNSPFVQIGTVIQGPTEYYSSRLQNKERGDNIVEELLKDAGSNQYFKKKYLEIQEKKSRFTRRKVYKRKGRRS